MDQETEADNICYINILPDEVISIILDYNDCRDIVSFGSTCKRFNDFVKNDQRIIWRRQFEAFMPKEIFGVVKKHTDGNWLKELKFYKTLKLNINKELLAMSPLYFWRKTDVSLEEVRNFFDLAVSGNASYCYTILVLQEIVKIGTRHVSLGICEKPYTLTEMHYAKVALRHLIQTFLAVKWIRGNLKNELSPEIVLNLFLQWVDTDNFHSDEEVENILQDFVRRVEAILQANHPPSKQSIKDRCANGQISQKEILSAMAKAIYQDQRLVVTHHANLATLDICEVTKHHPPSTSVIAVAVIYQAVAKRFGVTCELVAFPNHLFLEWRDSDRDSTPHTVDLSTGEIHPKRQCPFSQNRRNQYAYSPDDFLQYIYASYHLTMGNNKNWNTQNSLYLLEFLGIYDNDCSPYRGFLEYLVEPKRVYVFCEPKVLPAMGTTLDIKYLNKNQLSLLDSLAKLNPPLRAVVREPVVKEHHDARVKFAVGMICYHRKYDYACVIRGWDVTCQADMEWQRRGTLEFGPDQPFYSVIAADQSERYVAQENLTEVVRPTRMYLLEDLLGREFTHSDGFVYRPNDEKRAEYPGEDAVIRVFREKNENNRRRLHCGYLAE